MCETKDGCELAAAFDVDSHGGDEHPALNAGHRGVTGGGFFHMRELFRTERVWRGRKRIDAG